MENEKTATRRQPIWIPIVHGLHVFLSIVVLGLSGYLIHGKYFNTLGYDIFISLLTWLVVAYLLVTAYISSFGKFSHIFLTIIANAVLVIFWLAAMGATAQLRSRFKYDVTIYGCYDDGSNIDSSTCLVGRDVFEKRAAVATQAGLSMMSAIAGVSAFIMLLFVATLVHAILTWYKSRSKTTPVAATPPKQEGEGYQMAAPHPQYAPAPRQQYAPAQQQQQQVQYAPPPQPYSPPPQQTYYPPPQSTYSPPPQVFTPPPQGYAQPGYENQQQYQYVQPQFTGPPQGGQAEMYVQPHHQAELPSPVQRREDGLGS